MNNYKIEKSDSPVYIQIYKKIKEDIILKMQIQMLDDTGGKKTKKSKK